MNLCELCDNFEGGKKREDNIYVCDECNEKHPLKEEKWTTEWVIRPVLISVYLW